MVETKGQEFSVASNSQNFHSLFFQTVLGLRPEARNHFIKTIEECGGVFGYTDSEEGKDTFYFYANTEQLRDIVKQLQGR